MAFMICFFPAILSSIFSAYSRLRLLYKRLKARSREALHDSYFGKQFRRQSGSRLTSLRILVEFYKLAQDRRRWAEKRGINNAERHRAYIDFLLICCEDGPFVILNLLLIRSCQHYLVPNTTGCQHYHYMVPSTTCCPTLHGAQHYFVSTPTCQHYWPLCHIEPAPDQGREQQQQRRGVPPMDQRQQPSHHRHCIRLLHRCAHVQDFEFRSISKGLQRAQRAAGN